MSIGMSPQVHPVSAQTGRDPHIEPWVYVPDSLIDELVQFFFCDRPLGPTSGTLRFGLVLVVETKLHGAKDDVEALKENMVS